MSAHSSTGDVDEKLSTVQSHQEDNYIDPVQEAKLRRKLDFTVLPIVTICYLLTFLDRGNIGNAKAAGLVTDTKLQAFDFNIGQSLYFLVYLLLDIPCSLLVKRYGFILIPISVVAFGLVTLSTAYITDRAGFYVTRIMLGFTESFSLPAMSYLLNRYYRRSELTTRYGILMLVSAGGAGGFGGLLAAGLLSIKKIGTRSGWRNIFLVEGIITMLLGVIFCIIFPTDPEKTKLFNEEERKLAIKRIFVDQPQIKETKERTRLDLVYRGIFNINNMACVWLVACSNTTVQGLSIFLPTILKLNYPHASNIHIQLLTVPVYVCACGVGIIISIMCTKLRLHWPFSLFGGVLSLIGYSIWISTDIHAVNARYAACFINMIGGFINGPVVIGWAAANASPDTLRAMVGAVVFGLGGFGAIAGVWAYTANTAKSSYHPGNSFNLAMGASCCVVAVGLMLYQKWENKMRDAGKRDYRLKQGTIETLGNLHPSYRYIS